ncbi:MAG: PadR family transcriptional regulator [Planctomycetota bacterium]|nr:MAG: PadR family transcriptional regulator [Planctomycetota bacterium]
MENRFLENWTTQIRKGILELCILNAMKGARLYGYDIVKKLSGIEGLVIGEGTIYPILSRFKREGLVKTTIEESSEGPARKYYQLTGRGEQYLARMNQYWGSIKNGTDALITEQ